VLPICGLKAEKEIFARDNDEAGFFQPPIEFFATDRKLVEPEPEKKGPFALMDSPGDVGWQVLMRESEGTI
jgi:hypothetical protein